MDSSRFDALSRSFASRGSRRDALRRLVLGGLGAGAAAAALTDSAAAADLKVCVLSISARVATGTDKGTTYNGDLSLTIDAHGAIDEASLKITNGKTHKVVGQAVGRAISLRVELSADKILSLNGIGEQDLILCRGQINGTFGGPAEDDLGTWRAVKKTSNPNSQPTPAPTQANGSGSTGGSSSGNGAPGGNSSSGDTATDTPTATPTDTPTTTSTTTPAPAPIPCVGAGQSCVSASCCVGYCNQDNLCDCVPDGAECQHIDTGGCCSGAPCNSGGYCGACAVVGASCASDNDCCYGQIAALCCYDSTVLAYACTDVGSAGACPGGAPANNCPSGQTACGSDCADLSSDARHCGSCGTSCGLGAVCSGGVCTAAAPPCLDDGADCNFDTDCCGGFCIVGVLGVHDYCSH